MVFQSYALFPHLDVAENILFGLKVRRVPAAERTRRLHRVVELLGLAPLLRRKPSQLSGGQQQRVALGRALIAETPVCLMDERLSNLDAQLRAEMRREIRGLQQQLGFVQSFMRAGIREPRRQPGAVSRWMASPTRMRPGAPTEAYTPKQASLS
jgi:sn-glycerol 3-phosphate transport system ATP-binding protein